MKRFGAKVMKSIKDNFRILDFVIFGGIFVISAFVGTVFGYRDRKSKSTDNYYFGGRKISPYLELRFHRRIRIVTSFLEITNAIFYLGITVYVPSLALSAVTPLSLQTTIAITSATCTFYTAVGGMKAVIWTDVFQSVIMIVGMLAVLIKGIIVVGGFNEIISAMERGGRNNSLVFDPDPRIRGSFWTIVFGVGFITCQRIVSNQIFIQRWLACGTVKEAKMAVGLSGIPIVIFFLVSVGNGLVMYAHYEGCDPLMSEKISKIDQTMPLFAVEIFYNIPGMAGLFVSAAFCGTLSTVSSGINSLAALAMMDFVLPLFPNLSAKRKIFFSKFFTLGFGLIVMLLSFAISLTSSNIVQFGNSIAGFIGGPVLGVFTLGIFMPWIDHKGAMAGFLFGFACTCWVGISAILNPSNNSAELALTTDNCTMPPNSTIERTTLTTLNVVFAHFNVTAKPTAVDHSDGFTIHDTLYAISPFMYGVLGFITSITGAHIISIFTGFSSLSNANADLFVPFIDNKLLPEEVRKFFRFGVPVRSHTSERIAPTDGTAKLANDVENTPLSEET
ncbi:sodium-coupled monocarboxylate transporter 2-like isoform X2 [Styela clava]